MDKKSLLSFLLLVFISSGSLYGQELNAYVVFDEMEMDFMRDPLYVENVNGTSYVYAVHDNRVLMRCELLDDAKGPSKTSKESDQHQGGVVDLSNIAYSEKNKILATAGKDARIKIWNSVLDLIGEVEANKTLDNHLLFANSLPYLVYGYSDEGKELFCVYDYEKKKTIQMMEKVSAGYVTDICFSPDDKYLILASEFAFTIYEVATGQIAGVMSVIGKPRNFVFADPLTFAFSNQDGKVNIYTVGNGVRETANLNFTDIEDLRFDAQKRLFVLGHLEGSWSVLCYPSSLLDYPKVIEVGAPMIIMHGMLGKDAKTLMVANGGNKVGLIDLKWGFQ